MEKTWDDEIALSVEGEEVVAFSRILEPQYLQKIILQNLDKHKKIKLAVK